MCEYCNDDYTVRSHLETPEGHEIEIDKENDLSITLDLDISEDFIWIEIKYCPWCGRKLSD
ncbi:gp47 [Listeria phage P35]|uniref:Uncharacterized protein n=1 Tax=Listeria phage LP-083-1 TaxID=1458854 RepID=A0A059T5J8_9CAUD|nr:gp47 [Listeria phage P35]AAY53232.1 gp47 [Listeria phage P35]AHL19013.1 hypothetical protein LP083-1_048 [Listeria phage LP-083-1]